MFFVNAGYINEERNRLQFIIRCVPFSQTFLQHSFIPFIHISDFSLYALYTCVNMSCRCATDKKDGMNEGVCVST